ncbi:MAG: hypothetical protein AUF76_08700 [Acidobacteria bacterium 13_1_20CM_2_65_9]|nr:MAG: hypothetical protein AUF76_08700 [Acidobacteria bacterium 13_1_20CM_2_65_9]
MLFVDQPDTARTAVAFLDHRLRQRAEEAFDVRLTHQQIERELDNVGLHLRQAIGAAARGRFSSQRGAKHVRIALIRMHIVLMVVLVAWHWFHFSIIHQFG